MVEHIRANTVESRSEKYCVEKIGEESHWLKPDVTGWHCCSLPSTTIA
jgi:hypothetical protein